MGFTFKLSLCGSKGERKVDTNNCANTSRRIQHSLPAPERSLRELQYISL